jgi:hypothetical protein
MCYMYNALIAEAGATERNAHDGRQVCSHLESTSESRIGLRQAVR